MAKATGRNMKRTVQPSKILLYGRKML